MATITKITGLPKHYLSWGDTVDLNNFSVTVKLASNQSISSGDAQLFLAPFPFISTHRTSFDMYYPHVSMLCKETPSRHDGVPVYDGSFIVNSDLFSISKGGTKTIKFLYGAAVSTVAKIPDNNMYLKIGDAWELGRDYFESRFYSSASRIQPLSVLVYLWDGTREYDAILSSTGESEYYFLTERLNPVIDSIIFEDVDARNITQQFGDFVQGESNIRFSSNVTLDPLDPELTFSCNLTLTLNGITIYNSDNDTGIFDVGKLNVSGTIQYSYTVTDSENNSATQTGSFVVLPYALPTISLLPNTQLVTRWGEDVNLNHVPKDDGENVWLEFTASASSIDGKNSWTIKSQSFADDGSVSAVYTIFSGTDGSTKTYSRSEGTVTPPSGYTKFSQLHRFDFTVTVEDWFGNTAFLTGTVDKAGGYLNVEKYGVGVGMRTTADENNKKFEVSEEYESCFYGGVFGGINYKNGEMNTGIKWIDGKPIYRYVYRTTTTQSGGTTHTLFTLPDVDTVLGIRGMWKSSGGSAQPVNYYVSTSDYAWTAFNSSNQLRFRSQVAASSVIIIMEYTKTQPASAPLRMIAPQTTYNPVLDDGTEIPDEQALNIITGEQ